MQHIIGNLIFLDILPNLLFGPVNQRIKLHEPVLFIPFNQVIEEPGYRLVFSQSAYPDLLAGQGALQGLVFTNVTTEFPVFNALVKQIDPLTGHHILNLTGIREINLNV